MIKYLLLILLRLLSTGTPEKADRQNDYIVIEKDYCGDILLDPESGVRYLRTDDGVYVIE